MNETLSQPYKREAFFDFLGEFLPSFSRDTRAVTLNSQNFKDINSLGSLSELDLQVFEVKVNGSLDKRVSITTDAFKLMKTTASYRALVAFHTDDSKQWRLSFMTAQPTLKEGKVVTKLSNPRRFSYLLGPGSKLATPTKQLISKGKVTDYEDLSKRFAVEVVNTEFYREIAKLYDELVGTEKNQPVLKYPSPGEQNHEFAVRLIGRIIFCWFLREKRSTNGTPLIPETILSRQAAKLDNYYHSILAPLFFEVLNKHLRSREQKFQEEPYSIIPYLNGGLFSPDSDDHYRFDKTMALSVPGLVDVPDEWLRKLFDLLELYNFTVDENTSYDIDLSIDPEMLGRIFENLLARINPETGETVRKSTGSFYTPREIVEYMVDESLKEYLKKETQISEAKLSALTSFDLSDDEEQPLNTDEKRKITAALSNIKILDPACGSGAFPIGILQKIVFMLRQVDPDTKFWLDEHLAGASIEFKRELANQSFDYIRKSEVIRKSIFGVDIQPIATEIARLRCFLTLIVDENINDSAENRGVKVLPNLDFKFVTANSLIRAPGNTDDSPKLFDSFEEQLGAAVDEYFSAEGAERAELSHKLRDLIDQKVNENKQYVLNSYGIIKDDRYADAYNQKNAKQNTKLLQEAELWESYKNIFKHKLIGFFETKYIFPSAKDGFDIVIANPPYVSEKGRKEMFRQIASHEFGKKYYKGKMDLFYFFLHAGLDLLKDKGTLCFITTNYYLTATNADKLRADYRTRATLLKFINFHELKVFESALGQHNLITLLRKGKVDLECHTAVTSRNGYLKNTHQILANILAGLDEETEYYSKSQQAMFNGRGFIDLRNSPLSNVLEGLTTKHRKLEEFFDVSEGLQTGNNKVFVFSGKPTFYDLLSHKERSYLRPFFKNSDVEAYYTQTSTDKRVLYITKAFQPDLYPQLSAYLKRHQNELAGRAQIRRSLQPWYTLLWPRTEKMFTGTKIVFPYRAKTNIFSLVEQEWYSGTDTYFIYNPRRDLKLCLAILNSNLAYHWLKNKGAVKGEVLELKGDVIMDFPFPTKTTEREALEKDIVETVNRVIAKKQKDNMDDALKEVQQIDQLIYKYYDLSEEEIAIIEGGN